MMLAIVESSTQVARSAELWMGVLSAILGCVGGGIGSVIALWADRRKRKMEQKRDLTKSERMGLVRVNVKKMQYSSVPESEEVKATSSAAASQEIKDGEKGISRPNGVCGESHERLTFINAVQEMLRGLKSGIVVITGPNDTGKETLLNHAVASCMPHSDEEATSRRWRIFPIARKRKERCVSFYRVKDMTRQWDKIRADVLEWFEIRAEKLMTGEKICVVYLDFHSLPKDKAAQTVDKIKDLYEDIGRLGQAINYILAVKITGEDVVLPSDDFVRCFKISPLRADQMQAIQDSLGVAANQRMDRRRMLEITEGGRIGRLMSVLRHDASVNKDDMVPDYLCKGWFENDYSVSGKKLRVGTGMALVYLTVAMARRMGQQDALDVRALIMHVIGMDADEGASYDSYRSILHNAILSKERTDFSAVRRNDFNMDYQTFWNMFLSGWGVFGKYDFMDDLHRIVRSLLLDAQLKSWLMPAALAVSDALIETSYSKSAETSVVGVIIERFSALAKQTEKISEFGGIFHIAFSRSLAAWLWRHIGILNNDRIAESVTKVVTMCGRKEPVVETMLEFMPVLIVVCRNPVEWFGGNNWWAKIDVSRLDSKCDGEGKSLSDVAEMYLLLVSSIAIALSHTKRYFGNEKNVRELIGFVRYVRHMAYPYAREDVRNLVWVIWRISSETYLLEKGCYHDKEVAERIFLSLVVQLLHNRERWFNTPFAHLVPALVRELKLDDFSFSPINVLNQLTAGLEISVESISAVYERCYMQTLAGLLHAYRNFYGTFVIGIINELTDKLHSEKAACLRLSKSVLDSTRTFEPEKLRCLIWILSNAVNDVFKSCNVTDAARSRFVRDLVRDALALQRDLTDQYRAYCFMYLSRICEFMGKKAVDNRPSDLYAFTEALSLWLNDSGIIKELQSKEGMVSSRCRSIMRPLPTILVNVYIEFSKAEKLWADLEKAFKGHNMVNFVNAEFAEYVLLDAKAFVVGSSADCRESLIRAIGQMPIPGSYGLRRRLRRIAELSVTQILDGFSAEMQDEEFFDKFFALFKNPEMIKVDVSIVWRTVALLLGIAANEVFAIKAYDFVRQMESNGLMQCDYQTDWLYYYGLANNVFLLELDGYDDWCCSFVNTVPFAKELRGEHIQLAFRLRNRIEDGLGLVKKEILELVNQHEGEMGLYDYEWRVAILQNVNGILYECLSAEEQEDVRKFVVQASKTYRSPYEDLASFMQTFLRLDVSKWIDVVGDVFNELSVKAEVFNGISLAGDNVDVVVKTHKRTLLLAVLPDADYEVDGSISDVCYGAVSLVRDRVISLGFIGMLQRARKNYMAYDSSSDVEIGIVANGETLKNIVKAARQVGIHGNGLHFFDYKLLQDQMEEVLGSQET